MSYLSQSKKKTGCWCGVADDYGDVLTYWVLTDDTKKLILISDICPTHICPNQYAQSAKSNSPLPGEPEHADQSFVIGLMAILGGFKNYPVS